MKDESNLSQNVPRLAGRRSSFFAAADDVPVQKPEDKKTPLIIACEKNDYAEAGRLLNAGANPNEMCENGRKPLHTACVLGSVALVKLLLSHKATPNFPQLGRAELDYSVFPKYREANVAPRRVVRNPEYPLALAVLHDREPEIILVLLEQVNETGINGTDGYGDTALEMLCARDDKNFELAKAIVDKSVATLQKISKKSQQWLYDESQARREKGEVGLSDEAMIFLADALEPKTLLAFWEDAQQFNPAPMTHEEVGQDMGFDL